MVTVALTAAGRGIGLELVKQHLAAGDRIFALVRNPEGAKELNELASGSSGRLTIHKMDVADPVSVAEGAASTGGDPIDILYNVAGYAGVAEPEVESTDWVVFDEVFDVNVKAPLRVLQAFLPRLGKGSKVINFASQLGASTWPYGGFDAYCAAKASLGRLMRGMAMNLKDSEIIVGIVHPGWVQTDMGGPTADLTPQESAKGVCTVAKDWMLERSGEFLQWNGELHAW